MEELLGVVDPRTPHWPMHVVRWDPHILSLQDTSRLQPRQHQMHDYLWAKTVCVAKNSVALTDSS